MAVVERFLASWYFGLMLGALASWVPLVVWNVGEAWATCGRGVSRPTLYALFAVFATGLYLRTFVVPHYHQDSAMAFRLFGIGEHVAYMVNSALGALTILLFLAHLFFLSLKRKRPR